jgi:hypothetical protein
VLVGIGEAVCAFRAPSRSVVCGFEQKSVRRLVAQLGHFFFADL